MITPRPGNERGHTQWGWLDSYHTFSFGEYYDPRFNGFQGLRVINEDRIEPGRGFGTHPHRDMEIVTLVLEGALEHRDSLGTGSIIRPGDVQRMTAGTGITHSEYNQSGTEPVHLVQIWILPERLGLEPGYEQRSFSEVDRTGRLCLVASRDGRDGSVTVRQNIGLYTGLLEPGTEVFHQLQPGRNAWLQILRGSVMTNRDIPLQAGDGGAVSNEEKVRLKATAVAEVLLFDLP